MENQTYTDALAAFGAGGAHPGSLALTKRMLSGTKIDQNSNILDAGCGTGQTAAYLQEVFSASVTAIDKHPVMAAKAKERLADLPVTVLEEDLEALPFQDNSFDIVLTESVLAFTNVEKTLAELRRVLKQDGLLFAVEMTRDEELDEEEIHVLQTFYGFPQILNLQEWQEQFRLAGFEPVESNQYKLKLSEAGLTLDDLPDFMLSEEINETHTETLDIHKQLTDAYKERLSYAVMVNRRPL